ncbi:tyrosine-type recombinase/integrase [Limosilactobacillus oris]|uniref:tyrosine-type recombinase/integrase n=1 Tax=Limosilactobacillus oris TaxID=1632 RepID=UPI0022359CDB|nr:site-specific integrase [Limosilactobacillus oris]MCW4388744.1 site-specific integrase [Limosilactobacillus oris]
MFIQKSGKKFRLVDRYKDPLTGKLKRITIGIPDKRKSTVKEASIKLNRMIETKISEIQQGNIVHGITLGQVLDEYEKETSSRVRRSTYYNHLTMAKNLRAAIGEDALVEKITPKVITNFIESLMYGDRNISSGYASKYKYFVHTIMEFAIKQAYIKNNPVDKVEIDYKTPISGAKIQNKFLEQSELDELLKYAYAHNTTYAQLCEWLYLTGSRIGEATSLNFNDVHQQGNHWVVEITGTLDYDHVKIADQKKTDNPKTATSVRTVILPEKAIKIYQARVKETGGRGFLFCTANGTPIQSSALNTFLRNAKKKLGIDKPLSSHIFRHTHISKLAELGVPIYVIQQRVGHADSKVTRQIYLHVTQKAIEQEANKLDKL